MRFLVDILPAKRWPVVFSLILIGSSASYAQDIWQGPTNGSWFTPGNWSLGTPPSIEQNALVDNGTVAQIGLQVERRRATAGTLTIGATVPGSTVQLLPGGTLDIINPLIIGADGTLLFSGGNLSGGGNVIHNDGTVAFETPSTPGNEQLIHSIDGSGRLIVDLEGTSTLKIFSTNTYGGGTILIAGTLQADSTTALSPSSAFTVNSTLDLNGFSNTIGSLSGTGTVLDNGAATATLTIGNDNSNSTFGGVLENGTSVLALIKSGSGVLTLTGANSYTGGTTISAGTLQLGNGGTTGSITGNVIDNGILAFNRSDVLTFNGVISGAGSVQQIGPGTTILTGTNTYTGGTTISAGTLQLGNGGTTGSITGNVIDNGILAFNRSDSVTFNGVIGGQGALVKQGGGTLTLTGMSTEFTGPTTVDEGSLIVDGSIASTQTLVSPGALLGGHGFLGGDLVSSGIVSPGNSPGTLTVSGNYTQNANGTLRIEIAGLAPGQHDLLAIGGHANLAGTLQLIRLGGFQLHIGDKVTFITANGGVSGTFSTVQNDFATLIKTQIIILPNAVVVQGTQGSFAEIAMTPNCAAVARSLDSAVGDPRASTLINFLNNEPVNKLCPGDFDLISPEQLASVFNITVSLANVQSANLERRMDDVRAGSTGFNSAGFTMNGSTPNFSGGLAGPTGVEGKSGPSVLTPIPENRWGVFAAGLGEFTHVDSTDNARGYDLQTGGVTLGVDYRIGSNFAVGLIAGYAHTNADLPNSGNMDVNSGKFGLYGTAFSGGFYLDSAVTGGISEYDSHRTALLGTASGSTDGGDLNVLVNGGYDLKKGGLSIGPTASFQYTYVSFNGFTESGSLAPLKINDQHVDSIRTAFGMKASYDWKVGNVLIRPELRAAWQHEYGNSAYSIVASFANGAGSSFTVSSPNIGRDSLLLGAGVAVLWTDRISTYIYYDGELGRTNYDSHNVTAGVRLTF
jgi:outer membrane autotransporter protein